jgi:hypothetical protein
VRYRLRAKRFFRASAARTLLAVLFSLALSSGVAPSGFISATQACSMPCCAGKARHPAGSCSGGHCHARLSVNRNTKAEKFCGVRPLSLRGSKSRNSQASQVYSRSPLLRAERQTATLTEGSTTTRTVEAIFLTNSCPPDCGACAGVFAQLRRSRDSAALSGAARPRPPNVYTSTRFSEGLSPSSSARFKQTRPRAPPFFIFFV